MCLEFIIDEKPDLKKVTGYKVLWHYRDGRRVRYFTSNQSKEVYLGKTMHERGRNMLGTGHWTFSGYQTGFHLWHSYAAAKAWRNSNEEIIVRVIGRKLVCIGQQNGQTVYVCRQIRILKIMK